MLIPLTLLQIKFFITLFVTFSSRSSFECGVLFVENKLVLFEITDLMMDIETECFPVIHDLVTLKEFLFYQYCNCTCISMFPRLLSGQNRSTNFRSIQGSNNWTNSSIYSKKIYPFHLNMFRSSILQLPPNSRQSVVTDNVVGEFVVVNTVVVWEKKL